MSTATMAFTGPTGRKPASMTWGRVGVYSFMLIAALFFLLPLWIMIVTSLKTMDEIRLGHLMAWPADITFQPWVHAWSEACTGLVCEGIRIGFWNSVQILIPSVIISIAVGMINGYALSFWRVKGADLLFAVLLVGAFIPYQVFLYPLIRIFSTIGIYDSLIGIVVIHTIFGMPIMTLLFRNFYSSLPIELFNAARIDGGGFWMIFWKVVFPMSTPMIIVAVILQVTGIWNDFILGLTFAGADNHPMTVQLNNVVNSVQGEKLYNVDMAATMLTGLLPLVVYFVSGRWFVRGIAAGAVKG